MTHLAALRNSVLCGVAIVAVAGCGATRLAGSTNTGATPAAVSTDLSWFDRVTPCGIEGAGVASLETLGALGHTPEAAAPVLAAQLARVFGRRLEPAGPLTSMLHARASAVTAA